MTSTSTCLQLTLDSVCQCAFPQILPFSFFWLLESADDSLLSVNQQIQVWPVSLVPRHDD